MRLKNKTALITGGTSGIGLATAKLFVREGARVAVTGRDSSRFEALRRELGDEALIVAADVRSPADMRAASRHIGETFGGLDILFANAGIAYATPLAATDEARYDEIMDVNLKGTFFTMQAVSPILHEGASVILTTSFIIHVGRPGLSLLSASKAAVRSLARTWSRELLDRKIRVNAISPGGIDTPLHGRVGGTPEKVQAIKDQIASRVPLGRIGEPDEIAAAALFLASDESQYILGAELVVDGGISQI
ncbi:MAG: glucose 1-dehydrogenase [Paraburkholderia tropica]|uniref:NAD(P)-dependent dehydrogenase (Short-subunit alcohol dehydrogenase family) n=1 Tax=Paraburkholderia tropica TaxID=92647 RepID=A0ABX5MKK4_9BURK|nr:glucose 1-dehydrogenase [Paraburkholderia tropica]PXX12521.1 NAD(P)-dependent dehydrogenase (short-subunit alcohol dehydrogenase family) [Paraburkholderia tropica]PZW76498.1 NAD(P)-dependent dehydrogenase (short-subunit alcohol dehydrogenase family) [Paraburkholderia tropica]